MSKELYCSPQSLRNRMKALTQNVIGDDILIEAIREAQEEIDGELEEFYLVPFSPVPKIISKLTRLIAMADLLEDVFGKDGTQEELPKIKRLQDKIDRLLTRLKMGESTLINHSKKPDIYLTNFNWNNNAGPALSRFNLYSEPK